VLNKDGLRSSDPLEAREKGGFLTSLGGSRRPGCWIDLQYGISYWRFRSGQKTSLTGC
jgi:hypothetical protein